MLLRRAGAPTINATAPLGESQADSSYFDENMTLYFKLQGGSEAIRIQPRASEMIIGRKSPESVMVPDIDLSPFGAGDKGVSRFHAGLRRQDNTVVLTDLDSRNHTHINGQRLHTHEVRVLRDGDELRLGRLVMYVYFSQG
jgi:pSer/pThr/pTyr-binding forkhead associated (FHA) protein